jgi:hypothetical protein
MRYRGGSDDFIIKERISLFNPLDLQKIALVSEQVWRKQENPNPINGGNRMNGTIDVAGPLAETLRRNWWLLASPGSCNLPTARRY